MGTSTTSTYSARCPLCGTPVLSVDAAESVVAFDLRPCRSRGEFSRGYTLCDDCGVLADLPAGVTLN